MQQISKESIEDRCAEHVDVAVVGDFAKDKIVFRGRVEESSGGAVYYGAIALKRMGLRTAVFTRLAKEDFHLLDELRREGVLVYAQPASETSGIENTYATDDMDHRTCRLIGFAGPFRTEDIPRISARTFLVGPIMAGVVDIPLVKELAAMGPVALDAQGFVRIHKGNDIELVNWPEKKKGLAMVKVLKVDDTEAEILTGEKDELTALKKLSSYGPSEIVLTRAKGVRVYAGGRLYEAPFIPRKVLGRTGRGDTCLATYTGKRLTALPSEACQFAAAATSLKLEKPGPLRASIEEVQRLTDVIVQHHIGLS